MSDHNHTGYVWNNAANGANRRHGPGTNFGVIDTLQAGTSLIVLCYSHGQSETFTAPNGQTYTSDVWDFVVTSDQDRGEYVADVFIDTGGDVAQQLGAQGTCDALRQHLANP